MMPIDTLEKFSVSETIKTNQIQDAAIMNKKISDIITECKLDKNQNDFFISANSCKHVDVDTAYKIAYNWREITKNFLFTGIKGLGAIIDEIQKQNSSDENTLFVLQTAFTIISDDLNNTHPVFKKVAPQGPNGIHYKWWEESMVLKMEKLTENKTPSLFPGTKTLLEKMDVLVVHPMGTAIQLRIVEAIAYNIASAFLDLFSKVECDGKLVFEKESDKLWILTHIEAEIVHDQQVCSEISGMAKIASTPDAQKEMLEIAKKYCQAWAMALSDFAQVLKIA